MKVRIANKEDFIGILKLFRQVHNLHVEGRPDIFKDADPIDFNEFINQIDKGMMFIIAEDDKNILGFIQCEILERETNLSKRRKAMHLNAGCVDSSVRRMGIMKMLIEEAKSIALQNNCDSLQLSVWDFNEVGKMTWDSFGFEPLNTRMMLKIK